MANRAIDEMMDYFNEITGKMNKDEKYVSKAEKVQEAERIEDTDFSAGPVYGRTLRVYLKSEASLNPNELKQQFERHFGLWAAMEDNGSRLMRVVSVNEDDRTAKVMIFYCPDEEIF